MFKILSEFMLLGFTVEARLTCNSTSRVYASLQSNVLFGPKNLAQVCINVHVFV